MGRRLSSSVVVQSPLKKCYAALYSGSGKCASCNCIVLEGKGISLASGKLYCENHFCCENCEVPISIGSSYITRRNFPYCKDCSNYNQPQCNLCHLAIGGEYIQAMDSSWHMDHFLCECCHIPLTEQFGQTDFFVHEDKPYCQLDYERLFVANESKEDSSKKSPKMKATQRANTNSPFASRRAKEPPKRAQLRRINSKSQVLSSPGLTKVQRQVPTFKSNENSMFRVSSSGELKIRDKGETDKRGGFLMKKETREEYVRIRESLGSFHANSEVLQPRNSESDSISLEALRSSSIIAKEQEDNIIGKKVLEQSTLVENIEDVLGFSEIVGKGGFATVREGVIRSSGETVAIKIFNKWELKDDTLIFIQREVGTLVNLNHPNIRQFRASFEDSHYLYLVMEYIKGESLYDHVEKLDHLPENPAKVIVKALLNVLAYLHGEGYIHQDVKTENILLPVEDGIVKYEKMKLIDFGFCRAIQPGDLLREFCGSYHYMASEMINRESYGLPVDLWSVGVVLYILLTGLRPFFSQQEASTATIQWFEEDWEIYSPEAKELVIALLNPNPKERLTAVQALNHPWFQE